MKNNKLSSLSLTLGGLSVILSIYTYFLSDGSGPNNIIILIFQSLISFLIYFVFGIVGLIIGFVAKKHNNSVMVIMGIILSAIGVLIPIIMVSLVSYSGLL